MNTAKNNHILDIALLAFILIMVIFFVDISAVLITHTFASTKDMVHEPVSHYGSFSNAITKLISETSGVHYLVTLVLILMMGHILIQIDEQKEKNNIIQKILPVIAISIVLIQLILAFNFLPKEISVLTFSCSLIILGAAYYSNPIKPNFYLFREMKSKPHFYEYFMLGFVILISLPWIFAGIGYYISDFPILGIIFWARQETVWEPEPGYPNAVHIGTHHGTDSFLIFTILWITVLWILPAINDRRLQQILGAITSYGFGYAIYNGSEDFITEQIYKRGWIDFRLPKGTTPGFNIQSSIIILLGAIIYIIYVRKRIQPQEEVL